ncbi:MAG TPA: NAD-dependent epimerase/dehydratase family protein, partial [Thermodesulfobacteriota bacterium]|nr:NAD-dependent epimerase/dehydratase family protein [Thermodesulfobacteriota bacterium]
MKPSVLITGASGFLGSWLFNHFHSHGYSTFGVDRSRPCTAGIFRIAAENCYCLKIPSIRFYSLLASVRPSVIIHAAGPSSVSASVADPESDFHDSVSVTEFLLQCIRRYSSRSALVYLSSAAVYGNPPGLPVSESMPCQPISPYGRHKQICEQMIQDFSQHYDVPCAVLRIFSAYGEGLRRQVIYD